MTIETKRRVAKGLQLGLVVGVLVGLSGLIQTAWLADPIPVLAQTVTVDSTQSPLVVNAVADLADLTPTDGQSVIIKTGTEKGLWYYDKDSATATSVSVLNGPGSVGRFLVINNDAGSVAAATAITAAEITDDGLLELQAFDGSSAKSLTLEELKKTGVQVVNVKQYGATGDGVADDTTAYLAVLAACEGTTSVAYFPPGTYLLGSLAQYGFQVSDTLTIRGDKAIIKGDSQVSHYDALTLVDGAELDIEGVTFDTFYIPIWGESTFLNGSLRVSKCKFTACEIGIASGSLATPAVVSIRDSEFYAFIHKGISWAGITAADISVIRNIVRDASSATLQNGIQIGDAAILTSRSILISENTVNDLARTANGTVIGILSYGFHSRIEHNSLTDVRCDVASNGDVEAGIYARSPTGSVSNNVLINAGRGNACIAWKEATSACEIVNNQIYMTDSTYNEFIGIRVYGSNCRVADNFLNGTGASVNTGVLLGLPTTNIDIVDNEFVNCVCSSSTGRVMAIPTPQNVTVTGNVITGCGTSFSGALAYGIDVNGPETADDVVISDNIFNDPEFDSAAYAIRVESHSSGNTGLIITGNMISGYHTGIILPTTTGYWSGINISRNTIDGLGASSAAISFGIDVNNVKHGAVSSNVIRNLTTTGSNLGGGIRVTTKIASGCQYLTINSNHVDNIVSAYQYGGAGVWFDNGSFFGGAANAINDIEVARNTVQIARRGVVFYGASTDANLSVVDNAIYGITGGNADDDYKFDGITATAAIRGNTEDLVIHPNNQLVEASTAGSGAPNVLLQLESRKLLTNEGTTAANYHTLPTAVAGLTYTFAIPDTDGIRVTAATGDTIRLGANVTATAGYVESTSQGGYLTVTAINATEWVGLAYGTWTNGTWTYEVLDTP